MANQATALRLEEEIQEQMVLESSRSIKQRPSQFVQFLEKNGTRVILPTLLLYFGLMAGCNVITAYHDHQRQRASRQLQQLDVEKRHNMLVLDKLATKPRMLKLAKVIGLEQPSSERIHIIKSASSGPIRQIAKVKSKKVAWNSRTGSQLAAFVKRVAHGPGVATLND